MAAKGVNVPVGYAARTPEEAVAAAARIGDEEVVIKSQILAGGRGLGTFTNGFKGGVHIIKAAEVDAYARKMLGGTLVTKQSGPAGKPVNVVMVAKKMDLKREMYFSILLNRPDPRALVIACAVGGTSIEDLAHSNPEAIVKLPVDMAVGMSDADALAIVEGLQCTGDKSAASEQIKALFRLFCECDCTMLEVNPLAEDAEGKLIAADAKVGFDDNAAFRQPEIFKMRDWSQEDPKEVQAAEFDLNYIALDGNIGCMVNGAGLAMATMDIIQLHGGKPANFLDVGGAAGEDQASRAARALPSPRAYAPAQPCAPYSCTRAGEGRLQDHHAGPVRKVPAGQHLWRHHEMRRHRRGHRQGDQGDRAQDPARRAARGHQRRRGQAHHRDLGPRDHHRERPRRCVFSLFLFLFFVRALKGGARGADRSDGPRVCGWGTPGAVSARRAAASPRRART